MIILQKNLVTENTRSSTYIVTTKKGQLVYLDERLVPPVEARNSYQSCMILIITKLWHGNLQNLLGSGLGFEMRYFSRIGAAENA